MISIKTKGIERLMELWFYSSRTPEVLWQGITCATCQTECGCRGCINNLPCRCTKVCNGCYKDPCICRLICNECKQYPCGCLPPPCAKHGTYPCECLVGYGNPWFVGKPNPSGRLLVPVEPKTLALNSIPVIPITNTIQINNNTTVTGTNTNIINFVVDGDAIIDQFQNQIVTPVRPRPVLSVQSAHRGQFYKPWMDSLGTLDDKKVRQIAVNFRNQVLGEKAKDLYSAHGLQVASKRWKHRKYVFYAHHQSAQVYDYDINIGRLDVHVPDEQDVPFGDLQLAFILKTLYDEDDMILNAEYSTVRNI